MAELGSGFIDDFGFYISFVEVALKKSFSLFIAFLLMSAGWTGAFLLAITPSVNQNYWLAPALTIGMAIGLCLRFVNGRKTALVLAMTAATGLATLNLFFPDRHISFKSVQTLFTGGQSQRNQHQLRVDERFTAPPFDKPLTLISPLSLDLALFTRLPGGVDDFCFSDEATIYASLPGLGAVYRVAIKPSGVTDKPELFLSGLDNPTGLACDPDQLLVAESSRIAAYSYQGGPANLLVDGLPDDGGGLGHRLLRTADGLVVSVESRCDACREKDPLRATLQLLDLNGELQPYSSGLRSISGLAFSSAEKTLWAGERSRLFPAPGSADEVNRILQGRDYGWPLCNPGSSQSTPDHSCKDVMGAEVSLQNRANPAGLMTTEPLNYPLVYRNSLLMVLQGDDEYKIVPAVVRLQIADGKLGEPVAFLGGWDGKTARPSAIHAGPDGAVFIADEINGAIYRAAWTIAR